MPTKREKKELNRWSQEIKKLDNYKCKLCNTKKHLVSHHIYPKSKFPKKRLDLNNGITLCDNCHADTHNWKRKSENALKMTYPFEYNSDNEHLEQWREISQNEKKSYFKRYCHQYKKTPKGKEVIRKAKENFLKKNPTYYKDRNIRIHNDPVLKEEKNKRSLESYHRNKKLKA